MRNLLFCPAVVLSFVALIGCPDPAKTFGIERWPVAAIKAYLGHSLATASGDQLAATLGAWQYGVLPGIHTIEHVAIAWSGDLRKVLLIVFLSAFASALIELTRERVD